MATTVLTYPIPAYQNVPIHAEFYQPRQFTIAAITFGMTTTITTTTANDYVVGQLIRLLIPYGFGSRQLNEQLGYLITINSPTQFVLDINSIGVDPFISASLATKAQTIPVGDVNSGAINSQRRINQQTYIPGSFINISPQ